MVALTAASVGVAAYASVVAGRAKGTAESANLISKDANQLARQANDLSAESNTVARQAVEDARAAPLAISWDAALVALAPLLTIDVFAESASPLTTELRARLTLLVDRLDDWDGFDEWLAVEFRLGMGLAQEALAKRDNEGQRLSIDRVLGLLEPLHTWAVAFNSNLRLFRREGYDGGAVGRLTAVARERTETLYSRNAHRGWTAPPERLPGISPLEP